jgi:Phytanoyl-CoA dioxygenase (PhyH)
VTLQARVLEQLARRAPKVEEAVVRANWRRHNRSRAFDPADVTDPSQRALLDQLLQNGSARGRFEDLFGETALFDEAAARAQRLYEQRDEQRPAGDGKATYLAKLATKRYDAGDPFVRIALHPAVLAVANGYLRLRSTLRALELWHTWPTPGEAIQTQLWHRDADDVMNVKLFCYFTDVTRAAGPLTYAPGTHPLGERRTRPEHDEHMRSTDEQMARIVPREEWLVLEGGPGTIVFADTCGYHKQLKPESEDRLKLVAQYVSGSPYVGRELELENLDASALTEDQHYAAFDRPPS